MTRAIVLCDIDGCLSDGMVYVSASGEESLRFSKRDGWRLEEALSAGIEVELVTCDPSASPPPVEPIQTRSTLPAVGSVAHRAAKLGLKAWWCCRPEDKAKHVQRWKRDDYRVVYIGDSPADLEAMRAADEAWCPIDGAPGVPPVCYAEPGPGAIRGDLGGGKVLMFTEARGGHGVLHEVLGYLLEGAK
jgi:3-deoxy-D-manno-octulosonate 8-phosphate phosphatase KdsC-like HAD superfamily phosphatase